MVKHQSTRNQQFLLLAVMSFAEGISAAEETVVDNFVWVTAYEIGVKR
jgi:hypothetical protein